MTKTYLTKEEALRQYPLSRTELDALIKESRVDYALLHNGEEQVIVYDDDLAAYIADRDITPEMFAHLENKKIGINEAGLKYGINPVVVSRWVKQGWIRVIGYGPRNKTEISEADVAYRAALGRGKKMRPGKKPFT